jgi:oligopeptidase B
MNHSSDRNNKFDTKYLSFQNANSEKRLGHLRYLQEKLFQEQKNRVQEDSVSPAIRMEGFWYFSRNFAGKPYDAQYRIPVSADNDWTPPSLTATDYQSEIRNEQLVFDANVEAAGSEYFHLRDLYISRDGKTLLYGIDTKGNEKYDIRLRDIAQNKPFSDVILETGGACLSPDGLWVFYLILDSLSRPFAVKRHRIGTDITEDVEVFRENNEGFRLTVTVSNDNQYIVITSASPTSKEVLILPVSNPEGEFLLFIKRLDNIKYSVQFGVFESEETGKADIPIAVIRHNGRTSNFEVDVIDMRLHEPPFLVGEGTCIARGDSVKKLGSEGTWEDNESFSSETSQHTLPNPLIFQGVRGLSIFSVCVRRDFISLSYRSDGLPHIAVIDTASARSSALSGSPMKFIEVKPTSASEEEDNDHNSTARQMNQAQTNGAETELIDTLKHQKYGHEDIFFTGDKNDIYSIVSSGNLTFDCPNMRYSITSYTHPTEIHEMNPITGEDKLVRVSSSFADFDSSLYVERRIWILARDGERVPVSLAWRKEMPEKQHTVNPQPSAVADYPRNRPMYITGYGAYGVSTDPNFSPARLSLLDRGILYAVVHVRGGGELGYAWHEQGKQLHKKTSFTDFIDATEALQNAGCTTSGKTVAYGSSAGVLLVAAAAAMAADRYTGVIADSPFVDPLTTLLNPDVPLTVAEWDEWGNPVESKAVYEYIKSYSPCENLPDPERPSEKNDSRNAQEWRFPAVLAMTAEQDARVSYTEALKWVSKLQRLGTDAIIKIVIHGSHGGVTGKYKRWEKFAMETAWCLSIMGIRD